MELVRGRHNLRPRHRGCAVTIGNFDGVHLGHQAVIEQLMARARALGVPGCVVTFEPHPREFFDPQRAPARLSRLRDKLAAIERLGVDRVLVLRCDRALTDLSPEAFIDDLLISGLDVRHLVIGDDFRFGHRRAGDFSTLAAAGERFGFGVEAAATYELDGARVSSTRVREALAAGDLDAAAQLLGGPYTMRGRVVHGQKLGRDLGYPTANIPLDGYPLPLTGVIAVLACTPDGRRLPGVANLGWRPTVAGTRPLLEVYAFDFSGDLYGQHLAVELVERLRPEEHFESLDQLIECMHDDARRAREILQQRGITA
ncbi:bifunctional riboflavin kinase/FAD synthetase [Halofilum ochraceum]|uniref:bifunctional riboflavin kinase/FAD synthetase n=1 Tax=Halofilum ochraceum TaxID=1611323 RepID=UPI0008DAA5B5|nr:bifunctional riboflavin kinase/FAD synthetase [Halofilum ochraceum]